MKVSLKINKLGVRRLQIRHTTRVTPVATDEKYVLSHKILVAFSFFHVYHYPCWKTKAFDCLCITSSKSDYPGPGDRPLPSRVGPQEIAPCSAVATPARLKNHAQPLSFLPLEDRVTPATLTSDLLDYAPGSTAYFTGSGFGVGETINMVVLRSDWVPQGTPDNPWTVTDGGTDDLDGLADDNFLTTWYVDPVYATNQTLTATGQTTGETANVTFTDSGFTGAIYTSYGNGTAVNVNGYPSKQDVYLKGGPQNINANGLPNGIYYFEVTDPSSGALLSTDPAVKRQLQVVGGVITGSYDSGSGAHANGTYNPANGSTPVQLFPFLDTPNNGGVYKVHLIRQSSTTSVAGDGIHINYLPRDDKTDNFHIQAAPLPPVLGSISGTKWEDLDGSAATTGDRPNGLVGFTIFVEVNANGLNDQPAFSTTTAANGTYSITNIPVGTYPVYEVNQAGYTVVVGSVSGVPVVGNTNTPGVDFANFKNVTLSGVKFEDHNGNGVKDSGDQGLSGWVINVGSGTATTDASGNWSLVVGPGTFAIQEAATGQPWTSFTQTFGNAGYPVTTTSGVNVGGNNFGNFKNVTLSGVKFEDHNGNGVKDLVDQGLSGWQVLVNGVNVGVVTDANGAWSYTAGPGTFSFQEVNKSGWTQTYGKTGYSVTTSSGGNVGGKDFGNFKNITVGGVKFYDANTNGIRGAGEPAISGWRVGIDVNGDNTPDYFTLTDATGSYSFGDLDNADGDNNPLTGSDLGPGTYTVSEGTQPNWVATTPTSVSVIAGGTGVQSGGTATADFGNVKLGQTGGKTKGFWGNKNGLALLNQTHFAGLTALNLRNVDGSNRDFTGTLALNRIALESWLQSTNATNMAYMLSAQLAATWLNVNVLGVSGGTMIHVGTLSASLSTNLGGLVSPTGFVLLSDIISSANTLLGTNGSILSGNALRAYAEALKDVCDGFNNNLSISVIGLANGWDTNNNGVLDLGEGLLGSWSWV